MNLSTWPSSWGDAAWRTRWQRWQATLPGLLQRQVRRTFRRWIYAATAFAAGVAGVWLAHADALDEFWRSEQTLVALRRQVATAPAASAVTPQPGAVMNVLTLVQVLDHLPGLSAQARLWPSLQQTLARQRLQLLSFRPVEDPMAAPLPSQAVALRLRGRFEDWVRAWSAMSEGVPVWSMERVHIHPQADSTAVEIDVLLRVWLRAGPDGPRAWQGQGAAVSSAARAERVFASSQPGDQIAPAGLSTHEPVANAITTKSEPMDAQDPRHWPLTGLRLLGIWHEADARYAILAFGAHWVRAQVGQRVSQEGHRLETIGDQTVNLRVGQGPVQVLNLEKGPR
jgi:hypothetical protein